MEIAEIRLGPLDGVQIALQELADKENEVIRNLLSLATQTEAPVTWDAIEGKPEVFPPDPALLPELVAQWDAIEGRPASFPPEAHAASHQTGADPLNIDLIPGTLTATKLTGTIDSDRLTGAYTSITGVGTLTTLDVSGDANVAGTVTTAAVAASDVSANFVEALGALIPPSTGINCTTLGGTNPPFFNIPASAGMCSNLDADLLDGQHGAYYLSLVNATDVLSDARLSGNVALENITNQFTAAQQVFVGTRSLSLGVTPALDVTLVETAAGAQSFASVSESEVTNNSQSSFQSVALFALNRYRGTQSESGSGKGVRAMDASMFVYNTGTTQHASGWRCDVRNLGAGTVTNLRGVWVPAMLNSGGGSITNAIGLDLEAQSSAAALNLSLRAQGKALFGAEVEIDGDLNHDGTRVGVFGVAPALRASALTQTYATADRTHAARTAVALTDSSAGTPGTTLVALPTLTDSPASADALRDELMTLWAPVLRNWAASLATQHNALKADSDDSAQFLNALVDDQQAYGWAQ